MFKLTGRFMSGAALALGIAALGIGQAVLQRQADAQGATVQAPRFVVDPLWPKPLPNNWLLGWTIGVWVDEQDYVWVIHRAGTGRLHNNEIGAELNPPIAECCRTAPPVLVFDPAGKRMVSTAVDGSVALWDLDDVNHPHVLHAHAGPITYVAFDGDRVLTTSVDRTARVWDLTTFESRVLFLANSGLKRSLELKDHGVFARVLVDGLKGKADRDGYEPDGLITVGELALGLLQDTVRRGLSVPGDLAIVGYDDIDFAAAATVPLTSVRQPRSQLGKAAMEMLIEEATDGKTHRHRQIVFEPELIVRESTVRQAGTG